MEHQEWPGSNLGNSGMHYGMGDAWILPSMWTYTSKRSMVAAHVLYVYVHLPLQGYGEAETRPSCLQLEVRTGLQFMEAKETEIHLTPYENL